MASAPTPTPPRACPFAAFIEASRYLEGLKRGCKDAEEFGNRQLNVREVIEALHHYQSRKNKGLQGFLDSVALMERREDMKDDDGAAKPGVARAPLPPRWPVCSPRRIWANRRQILPAG